MGQKSAHIGHSMDISFRFVFFGQLTDFKLNLQESSPEHSASIIAEATNLPLMCSSRLVPPIETLLLSNGQWNESLNKAIGLIIWPLNKRMSNYDPLEG